MILNYFPSAAMLVSHISPFVDRTHFAYSDCPVRPLGQSRNDSGRRALLENWPDDVAVHSCLILLLHVFHELFSIAIRWQHCMAKINAIWNEQCYVTSC
jgi:hypothetical protein